MTFVLRPTVIRFINCSFLFNHYQVRQNSSDLLYSLLNRGIIKQIFPNDGTILSSKAPSAYAGFDPTADSVHIGNVLVLITLLHWQRAGLDPIVVVGDATAAVGDPSGHKSDRKVLTPDLIERNSESIKLDIERIFSNHENYLFPKAKSRRQLGKLRILRNSEWYKTISIVDFVSATGRHIRVGDMLSRTSVRSRMESGSGINFSEFSYQVFQSYDWLYLFNKYNCRFQFGGSDQLGNITSGYNLISGSACQQVYGGILPLIESETGDKFGKSAGNAIYCSPHQTSAFDFYQFFIRVTDADLPSYLRNFTFISVDEIENIVKSHMKNPGLLKGQKRLAEEITLLIHGEQGLKLAERATKVLFYSDVSSLSQLTIEDVNHIFPSSSVSTILLEPGITVKDLTMKIGCFLNEDDANRIIQGGGLYVNFERITSPQHIIVPDHYILPNGITLIRIGKKTYYIVKWQ